jgi:proteic killer suppression protein
MDLEFADEDLRRLISDPRHNGGYSTEIIRSFRQKVQFLAAAPDELSIRNWRSLNYERLSGKRKHEWSIRLNGPWRLILQRRETDAGVTLVLTGIEQYH